MEKCVFLGIWGLEIHIFVVNVHFFPGRGQHLPGKCVFFPKSGNLCRVFKRCAERPSAGYRMADRGRNVREKHFFNGKMCIFGHLGPGNIYILYASRLPTSPTLFCNLFCRPCSSSSSAVGGQTGVQTSALGGQIGVPRLFPMSRGGPESVSDADPEIERRPL